jgi:diaminopimelate epimerase
MTIPYVKAHGARNDFLLTWSEQAPPDLAAASRAICDRHAGAGADGWLLVSRPAAANQDGAIRLFNSDGSESELSGNGTRCAAAFLLEAGYGGETVRIATGAGLKTLRLLARDGRRFSFEMHMGRPSYDPADIHATLPLRAGPREVTILNVGNPQCAVFVEDFGFDCRTRGAEIERHPQFPRRTNVSFVRLIDKHTIDVLFWERGAGETMSSGTGSTGAAAAARARDLVESPVQVSTPAGPLELRWEGEEIYLTGPAEIVTRGEFYW